MPSGIIQNLALAVRTIAEQPDAAVRFGMAAGFICDISLDSELDGLWTAVERGVLEYNHPNDEEEFVRGMGVPRVRDNDGAVVDLLVAETEWKGHPYIELAREVALLSAPEARILVLEAAAIRLIQDGEDPLEDLVAAAARVSSEGLDLDPLGIPLASEPRSQPRWTSVSDQKESLA